MSLPVFNVQQYDWGQSRAQVTYLNAHVGVMCSHFVGHYTPDDLSYLRQFPPSGSRELTVARQLPNIGCKMTLLWNDRGFQCIHDAYVSRVFLQDRSFALFVGWFTPTDMTGISGALCYDGTNAAGIVTGVQRDTKTTHIWVQLIDPSFIDRVSGNISAI